MPRPRSSIPVFAHLHAGCLHRPVRERLARCAVLLICGVATTASLGCAAQGPPSGQLIFGEEFDGQAVNDAIWDNEMAWGRYTTGQLEHYSPEALLVEDGTLAITASDDADGQRNRPYRSGVVSSHDRFDFTYGYVEIRARVPSGVGLWPAFWLAPASEDSGSEIDVFEILGHEPEVVYMTLHYDDEGGEHQEPGLSYKGPNYSDDYHTYAVHWTPDAVVWYIDGIERARQTEGVPDEPMYLIANLAVGGEWPGSPDDTTRFPASLVIDWIRVYEP